jgi:predicted RNase H-like HicB family nuclease
MFTEYVDKAMHKATYELLGDGTYFGEIPGFEGVWGNASTLEECRIDLKDALEGWLMLKLWLNDDDFPVLGRLSLKPRGRAWPKHAAAEPSRIRKAS